MDILLILIIFGAYWFFNKNGSSGGGAGSADHDQDDGGGWRKASKGEDPDEAEHRSYQAWAREEAEREDEFARFVDDQNEQERLDRRNHDD